MASPEFLNAAQLVTKFLIDQFSAPDSISDITSVEVSDRNSHRYLVPEKQIKFPELNYGFDDGVPKVKYTLCLILYVLFNFYLGRVLLFFLNDLEFSDRCLHATNMVTVIVFALFWEVICEHFSWSLPLPKMLCLYFLVYIHMGGIFVYLFSIMIMFIIIFEMAKHLYTLVLLSGSLCLLVGCVFVMEIRYRNQLPVVQFQN